MACRTNSGRKESAKHSSLEKNVPHQCHHWKSPESTTNPSTHSSEVSRSVSPPNRVCRIWKTRKSGAKRRDSAPLSPDSETTRISLDQLKSCQGPSINQERGSEKRQGDPSYDSKPQKSKQNSLTLGRISMWPSGSLPDHENHVGGCTSPSPPKYQRTWIGSDLGSCQHQEKLTLIIWLYYR